MFRIIGLIALLNISHASECFNALLELNPPVINQYTQHYDYPIEQIYPDLIIKNGYIPKGSRAFILWRSRTSPWVPDSAFLFHYMNRKEVARELGFLIEDSAEHLSRKGITLYERLSDQAAEMISNYFKNLENVALFPINRTAYRPQKVAQQLYDSVDNMFEQLRVSPILTKNKWAQLKASDQQHVRWLVTGDGRIYMWTNKEADTIMNATEMPATHVDMLALVTQHSSEVPPNEAPVVAFGNISFKDGAITISDLYGYEKGKDQKFDLLQYIEAYLK